MLLQAYLVISFFVFLFLVLKVLPSINPRALRSLPRAERFRVLRSRSRWWWLLILIIPIVNAIVTSMTYQSM